MKSKWNLKDIFENYDSLLQNIHEYRIKIEDFNNKYRNIHNWNTSNLYHMIKEYEQITVFIYKVHMYLSITHFDIYSQDSNELYEITDSLFNLYESNTGFFPFYISNMNEELFDSVKNKEEFAPYIDYIFNLKMENKYALDSKMEEIIQSKKNTGYHALQQIYLDAFENMTFEVNGATVHYNELLGLINCDELSIRKLAAYKLGLTLKKHSKLFTQIFNYMVKDLYLDASIHGYDNIYFPIFRENEINADTLLLMEKMIYRHVELFQNHYRNRARKTGHVLSVDFTTDFDSRVDYEKAKEIIKQALNHIAPKYQTLVDILINTNHIDYECKQGKQSGSICFCAVPDIYPYIFINYSGTTFDLFTLAHEIGHAIHFCISAEVNSLLNYQPSNLQAEICAVFFETVVCFEYIETKHGSMDSVLEVSEYITGKLFRQALNSIFEISIYKMEGYAEEEDMLRIWCELRERLYGDTVEFYEYENYNYWSNPHMICEPLLTTMYTLSQVIAINLYKIFLDNKDDFWIKLNKFMHCSGNSSYSKVLKEEFHIDINDQAIWRTAFDFLRERFNLY